MAAKTDEFIVAIENESDLKTVKEIFYSNLLNSNYSSEKYNRYFSDKEIVNRDIVRYLSHQKPIGIHFKIKDKYLVDMLYSPLIEYINDADLRGHNEIISVLQFASKFTSPMRNFNDLLEHKEAQNENRSRRSRIIQIL